MTKMTTVWSLMILISSFSAPTFASQAQTFGEAAEPMPPSILAKAEELSSEAQSGVLTSPDGEIVGAIVDFIFDLRANRILYAAGVLHEPEEFRNRVLIIPWSLMQVNLDLNSFTVNKGELDFETTPSFVEDAWPSLSAVQWKAAINAAWKEGRSPDSAAPPVSAQVLARASDLIGKTVKTAHGETVGDLAELLVDPEHGSIAYAIISFDDSGDNSHVVFYSLPWATVQADPVQLTFVVPDSVKEELQTPPLSPVDHNPVIEDFAFREMNHITS